jgi:glucose-1-phosphate cytidylyltransferase
MQAVIFAGGLGTRLGEETQMRPKPLVEIGGRPIIWHIMKLYAAHGIREFIVCLGYKGQMIKSYFANYKRLMSDVTFDFGAGTTTMHRSEVEDWKVTLVDTGELTMTGGRVKRILPLIKGDAFCLTYGDGVADIDLSALVDFHRRHGRLATVTAVYPPQRFGILDLEGDQVLRFREKPKGESGFVSGGFFVLSPRIGEFINGDATIWEREPLENLAANGELRAFRHEGFFQPMDTPRDRDHLQDLWSSGSPPWRCW